MGQVPPRGREGHDVYDVRATLKELKLFTDSAERLMVVKLSRCLVNVVVVVMCVLCRVDIQAKFEGEGECGKACRNVSQYLLVLLKFC